MRTYNKSQDLWNRLKLGLILLGLLYIASLLVSCSEEETFLVRYEIDCRGNCKGYYDVGDNRTDSLNINDILWQHEYTADENDIAYVNFLFQSNHFEEDSIIVRIYVDGKLRREESEYTHLKRISALVSP